MLRQAGAPVNNRLDEFFEGLPAQLDVNAVAAVLGISAKGVYRWIHTGVIPAYKVGATWIILRDELKDTMAAGSNLTPGFAPAEGDDVEDPGAPPS